MTPAAAKRRRDVISRIRRRSLLNRRRVAITFPLSLYFNDGGGKEEYDNE